ncbi:C-C chemokine receptor type 5-like [Bombina bombina]|uniref:C-C chemokine receptor type 5-like n=1 Tax=Bombina bombina TaxID=8345 RepID=UPI00235A6656|nr:C-C chemokine receptor type 5-like [Bombina bombina]
MDPEPTTTMDYYAYGGEVCNKEEIKKNAAKFIPPLYILVFVLGFIGNTVVILILLKYKKLSNMTDIYLLNLAISDLLFVFSLPFWAYNTVYHWVFGNVLCKLLSWLYLVGFYSGNFFIILLTLDRYLAIVHAVYAMKARTRTFAIITSAVLWGIATFVSIPDLIFNKAIKENEINACSPVYPPGVENQWKLLSLIMMILLGLVMPLMIMVFCYTKIIQTLIKCRNEMKKVRAVKLVFIIMIVFFLFWTPYIIALIMYTFQTSYLLNNCETSKKLDVAIQWTEAISYFHCCLNPIIYAFVGEKFRSYLFTFIRTLLPNWNFCPFRSITHERHSSLYNSSTGEHVISAIL